MSESENYLLQVKFKKYIFKTVKTYKNNFTNPSVLK